MTRIDPTARVDKRAQLADDVVIGPYCVIGPEVRMGEGCVLDSHVVIGGKTAVGRDNRFSSFSAIGGAPQLLKDLGDNVGLVIGDGNTFREFVTVNTGTAKGGGPTRIGSDCFLMASSHVAHDCVLGDHIELVNSVLLAGHIHVHDRAIISGAAAMHHFTTVGTLAFVGGLSRIVQDVPPYMIVEGNPSKVRGINIVGLRRNGHSEEVIEQIKQAHRIIYRSHMTRIEALEKVEREMPIPEIKVLCDFVRKSIAGKQGRGRQP
jgi:UDP-N-acetylglucosamine acyltransferase